MIDIVIIWNNEFNNFVESKLNIIAIKIFNLGQKSCSTGLSPVLFNTLLSTIDLYRDGVLIDIHEKALYRIDIEHSTLKITEIITR